MSDVREIGPRIDLKKRAARKLRLRRTLAAMIVLVIAAILCWLVFFLVGFGHEAGRSFG